MLFSSLYIIFLSPSFCHDGGSYAFSTLSSGSMSYYSWRVNNINGVHPSFLLEYWIILIEKNYEMSPSYSSSGDSQWEKK